MVAQGITLTGIEEGSIAAKTFDPSQPGYYGRLNCSKKIDAMGQHSQR
jgi:hypothetical protein